MFVKRSNTFETNSSSSHSLVIRTEDLMNELNCDEYFTHQEMLDGLCLNNQGNFGHRYEEWDFGRYPFRILYDFDDRVRYAWANFSYDETKMQELMDVLKELVPELKKIIKPENCWIDEPYLETWMKKYNITLKEFLTNKKYITVQDGDEYLNWERLIKAGIIDTDVINNSEDMLDWLK